MVTDKLQLRRYVVSRKTAFSWEGTPKEGRYAKRAAIALGEKLQTLCPRYLPLVKVVHRKKTPQLLVALRLPAEDGGQAIERLLYYIDRASSARVLDGARWVKLELPWESAISVVEVFD